ncbi:MAG: NAD-dependent DNA ligase LigA [Oligoflexales bacterium]
MSGEKSNGYPDRTERVSFLADEIIKHKRLYYAGKPEISDEEFDRLETELQKLAPHHPVLSVVGTDKAGSTEKAEHRVPMLSLQKVYEEKELFAWKDAHDVVGSWKIDGNSISVVYEKGQLILAKTRGNGRFGENVTEKVRWIPDLLADLREDVSCEIRGELYCNEENFAKLVSEMVALGLERPTNPRNIVAGLLGRKTYVELSRYISFFAFDVLFEKPKFKAEWEKLEWLEQKGFALPNAKLLSSNEDLSHYLGEIKTQLGNPDINIDGAVFSFNDLALQDRLGTTSHHPRYKMSFKWQGQTAVAEIVEITWATSRLGIVTPVAVIDPVFLSGATITNVTLHNAEHVRTHNLKPGDRIKIVRSGEVIPKFIQVEQAKDGTYKFPIKCPSCHSKLAFDEIRLKCLNSEECPAQKSRSILNWIHAAEIDDLSDKRLNQMIESKLVVGIPDLYRLTIEDFMTLPLTHEKMATKLYNNIQKSKNLSLARFLTGLGIEGMGITSWEKLLEVFPSLEALLNAQAEEIAQISGFAEKTAQSVASGLERHTPLIQELLSVGVKPAPVQHRKLGEKFEGMQIAITGKLSRPRAEVEKYIKAQGGKPSTSVTSHTDVLVCNETETASSKMTKAKELGIPVWSEDKLYEG